MRAIVFFMITFLPAALPITAAEPAVTLSAPELNFAPQAQGTGSAAQILILTNSGGADLSITDFSITGENRSDFAQTNNCPGAPSALPALAHCEIRVTFTPSVTGTLVAVLSISDNASGSPHSVNLKGVSTAPVPIAAIGPANVAFGNQPVGSASTPKLIVLTNNGSATLNIVSEITITGPDNGDFRIQVVRGGCPAGSWQLAPKTSCQIGLIFAPVSIGDKNARLSVMDDAPGSPHSVALNGSGTAPQPTGPSGKPQ
jgi:hypothetical protein